jgi:hypothetical protein
MTTFDFALVLNAIAHFVSALTAFRNALRRRKSRRRRR